MFGHQNDVISQDQRADASVPLPEETINALTAPPAASSQTDNHDPVTTAPPPDNTLPVSQPEVVSPSPQQPAQSIDGVITTPPSNSSPTYPPFGSNPQPQNPQPQGLFSGAYQPAPHDTPGDTSQPTPFSSAPATQPNMDTPEPTDTDLPTEPITHAQPVDTAVQPEEPASAPQHVKITPHPDELLRIKQDALTSLSPLVGKLEVSTEEKFRTIMMLIQASDDPSQLSEAYELAQAISDEKTRAQALLDVVNEINYFTQKDSPQA